VDGRVSIGRLPLCVATLKVAIIGAIWDCMKDTGNRRLFEISNTVRGIAHKTSQIGFIIIDPDRNNMARLTA